MFSFKYQRCVALVRMWETGGAPSPTVGTGLNGHPLSDGKMVIHVLLKKDPGEQRCMNQGICCSSVIVNNWKQFTSQSIVDCLNKLWHNHKREPYVVIKKNEADLK